MAEVHKVEMENDVDVSITMKLSEAIVVDVILAGAIQELGPYAGRNAAIAELIGQAGSALAAVKVVTDSHTGESGG